MLGNLSRWFKQVNNKSVQKWLKTSMRNKLVSKGYMLCVDLWFSTNDENNDSERITSSKSLAWIIRWSWLKLGKLMHWFTKDITWWMKFLLVKLWNVFGINQVLRTVVWPDPRFMKLSPIWSNSNKLEFIRWIACLFCWESWVASPSSEIQFLSQSMWPSYLSRKKVSCSQ